MSMKDKLISSTGFRWAVIIGTGLIAGFTIWLLSGNLPTGIFVGGIASLSMFGLVNTMTAKAGRSGWGEVIDWKNMKAGSRMDFRRGQTSFGHLFPSDMLTGPFTSLRRSAEKLAAPTGTTNAFFWMEFGCQACEIYLRLEPALPENLGSLFTQFMELDDWRHPDRPHPACFNEWYEMNGEIQPSAQILTRIIETYQDWQASHPDGEPFSEYDRAFWAMMTRINFVVTDAIDWT